ncbi:MAG: gliding motility-associated C-terminal domain-containing protein [Flavobacteriales bacterium]
MKKILLAALVFMATQANAQISCTNCTFSDTTSYTNGDDNDSLFYLCAGQTATLIATPMGGTSPWDFVWQSFNVAGNSWNALVTQNDLLTSTQSNLQPNGYRCQITDAVGTVVGVHIVWVVRINTNPSVNVIPINPGCTTVQLTGQITNGTVTPYYNPPSLVPNPDNALIVDANTQITVCFSGTHTFVSDLAFHLRGPSSCGSPDITLAPSPGICNGGDNISNLCFSSESVANINICTAPTPLTGTYGSYGAVPTAINWAPLYGCDASQAGWAVQIWDCVGIDVGALTDATLTFSGTSVGGDPVTYSYTTPPGFNSTINDNSCSSSSASIFTVPAPPAMPINFTFGYIWTAEPPFTIPNNTSSLSILLNPGPAVDTEFTLELTGTNPGALCGGTDEDTEAYDFQGGEVAVIEPANTNYCIDDPAVDLPVNLASGNWSGVGIVDGSNGIFEPAVAGPGIHQIIFMPPGACDVSDTITMYVLQPGTTNILPVDVLCISEDPITLVADDVGGTWSGPGITDAANGFFDPEVAGEGNHLIEYLLDEVCPITGTLYIEVQAVPEVNISGDNQFCIDDLPSQLYADVSGGTWGGMGVNTIGLFDPAASGTGTFDVTYTVQGICEALDTEVITVNALPNVQAGSDDSMCEDDDAALNASGASQYTWSPTSGLSAGNVANPVASPSATTTYTVTGTDANGCVNSDAVTITVLPNPVVTATVSGENPICQGESTTLLATGLTQYNWTPPTTLDGENTATPTATPANDITYTVTGTDANGCSGSATVSIDVIIVNASFDALPDEGLEPLQVTFDNNSTADATFDWDFGNGNTATDQEINDAQSQLYETAATYTVTLTAYLDGCTDMATQTVFVYLPAELFTIPNVITPNGKDGNEVFFIESTYFETLKVQIYNRWGNEVGSIDSPGDSWSPGNDISAGTYYYTMRGEGYDGNVFTREGTLTILRDE